MIIDTETHIMYFARNAANNPDAPVYTRVKHFTWHEHDADLLVAEMDVAGVDKAFLISYDAEDTRWAAEQSGYAMEDFSGGKKYTLRGFNEFRDRFYWFSTLKNPRAYPLHDIIDSDLALGASGFKLFPAYIAARLDDETWLGIFDHLDRVHSRLLVSFETLRPPQTFTIDEYIGQLDRALRTVPALPVALLHAGCVDPLTDRFTVISDLCRRHRNVYLSTADPGETWDDGVEYPYRNLLARVERLRGEVGAERLMWGTDWPWFGDRFIYKQSIDCFTKHAPFFTADEKQLCDHVEHDVHDHAADRQPRE